MFVQNLFDTLRAKHWPTLRQRLLLGLILPVTLVVVVIALVLFSLAQGRLVANTKQTALMLDRQMANTLDYVWLLTLSQAEVLHADGEVFKWLNLGANGSNVILEATVQRRLRQTRESNPLLWSIYAYNAEHGRIIRDSGTPFNLKGCPDRELVKLLTNPLNSRRQFLARRSIEFSGRIRRTNVISAIIPSSYDARRVPQAALIINISVEDKTTEGGSSGLEQLFNTVNTTNLGRMMLVDPGNIVVIDGTTRHFGEDAGSLPYVKRILGSKSDGGDFITYVDGRKTLVDFATTSFQGWWIINIVPLDKLLLDVRYLRNMILILCGLVWVTLLVFSLLYSENMSRPVSNLARRAQQYLAVSSALPSNANEVEMVTQAFDTVTAQAEALQNAANTTLARRREELVKDRLLGIPLDSERDTQNYQELKARLSGDLLVTIFALDAPSTALSEAAGFSEGSLLLTAIRAAVDEALAKDFMHLSLILEEDQIAFIVASDKLLGNALIQATKRLGAGVRDRIGDGFAHTFTIGIGPVVHDLDLVNESFKGAMDTVASRFKYGAGAIIDAELLAEDTCPDWIYPAEIERLFLESLRGGRIAAVEEALDRFVMAVTPYSCTEIILAMHQLAFAAARVMDELPGPRKAGIVTNKRTLKKEMDSCQTMEEMADFLKSWCRSTLMKLENARPQRRLKIVEEIKAMVAEQHSNSELSLHNLSTAVNLSPNYLRSVFYEMTGATLADYLGEYRLQRAGSMLLETNRPVVEIAKTVGIANSNYFHVIFKRRFGVTPLDYRRNGRGPEQDQEGN